MQCSLAKTDEKGVITLEGDLTLKQAEELRTVLIKAIIDVEDLRIVFGKITEIDLSCLQLLCSAHRSSIRLNRKMAFTGNWPKPFLQAVGHAGYERSSGCKLNSSESCLWVRGGH